MLHRLTECWFDFCGDRCEDHNIQLTALPTRELPVRRGEKITVPGRAGYLFVPEGDDAYEDVGIVCNVITLDGYNFADVNVWLNQSGYLVFSDEPDRAYKARVLDQPSRQSILTRFDGQMFSLVFSCQPWRYHYPEVPMQTITNNTTIRNPGTAKSAPLIKLTGSGDMTLAICSQLLTFTDVPSGGIVVDSDAMECYLPDGTLANQYASFDAWPMLKPGSSAIVWTGASGVSILPRWRDI